jgi:hypothetical protein
VTLHLIITVEYLIRIKIYQQQGAEEGVELSFKQYIEALEVSAASGRSNF